MIDETTEMLARAWIACDPNRMHANPDEIDEQVGGPRWHWFIPRAEALADYLARNGYEIRKIDAIRLDREQEPSTNG